LIKKNVKCYCITDVQMEIPPSLAPVQTKVIDYYRTTKRRNEMYNRRKWTVIFKVHELAKLCEVDVGLIIRNPRTGGYLTYNSLNLDS